MRFMLPYTWSHRECLIYLQHGGVGVLCAKLLTIEVIDVAEEALTALDKLSRQHGYGRVRDFVVSFVGVGLHHTNVTRRLT